MFAVVKTGGKQYRVAKDDIVIVEKIAGEEGDVVALDDVLMIGEEGKAPTVGTPRVDKAAVFAEVVEQERRQGHRFQEKTSTELSPQKRSPSGTDRIARCRGKPDRHQAERCGQKSGTGQG